MARKLTEGVRWSLNRASIEFGINRITLTRRLSVAGLAPDESGTWSTREICAAVYGDLAGEKLRKLRAEADLAEMERDERFRLLIPSDVVAAVWTDALTNLRAIAMAADVPKVTRTQLIKQLQEIAISDYKSASAQDDDDDTEESA